MNQSVTGVMRADVEQFLVSVVILCGWALFGVVVGGFLGAFSLVCVGWIVNEIVVEVVYGKKFLRALV